MNEDTDDHPLAGRREQPRLRLQIPARITTLSGPEPVLLLDLSQSGARIACRSEPSFKRGLLGWMEFEFYGETVWIKKDMCALRFDPELDLEVVLATRSNAPREWQRHTDNIIEAARRWATGPI